MAELLNEFMRHAQPDESPPPVKARFFFTSPYAIDDPLSPLPPPTTTAKPGYQQPPRPFSKFDNAALEEAWTKLSGEIRKVTGAEGLSPTKGQKQSTQPRSIRAEIDKRAKALVETQRQERGGQSKSHGSGSGASTPSSSVRERGSSVSAGGMGTVANPFIRAPSRRKLDEPSEEPSPSRPSVRAADSYDWDDEFHERADVSEGPSSKEQESGPVARLAVGVSRLHEVVMPALQMEPIYWSPLDDVAPVIRATWFYKDSMYPVEADVANLLEAGYVAMQPWTQTWKDELNSAVEVGALGEERVLHKLWPEQPKARPGTAKAWDSVSNVGTIEEPDPEKERQEILKIASVLIAKAAGVKAVDNSATGVSKYGRDGRARQYLQSGVIYANAREAFILAPKLQPSGYYGRKPLANYIRKGRSIGVPVVRGFNQAQWNTLHPPPKGPVVARAMEGTSSAEAGAPPKARQQLDPEFGLSQRPKVTDLILVIHGIGQKLSEKVESYHFTYAMNAFRREVNVELGSDAVKPSLRQDMGGIMILPINWRLGLSFEDGGYREGPADPSSNQYSLKDITPDTLPSVRSIFGDVMLDIPSYLSPQQNPKMVNACIKEANRIYRLWCANNPGFSSYGRVHLIAHSLGSLMAFDILSNQPTHVDRNLGDPTIPESDLPTTHLLFNTSSLFTLGSPVGFFLLLRHAALLPRKGHRKPGSDDIVSDTPGVAGSRGQFGCMPLDNIYNVVNGYDPIAYRVNAAFDSAYSASLKTAFLPSTARSYRIPNPFGRATDAAKEPARAPLPRLPSNVELETHNFTREEIAEERAYLLNDNGQVDWYMRYGGGPLEIQYLTMLSAHSSYWLSRDFVRMIVVEVGRKPGREGTIAAMRAVKKKVGEK